MLDGKYEYREKVSISGQEWINISLGVWILGGNNIITPKVVIQPSGLFKVYVGKNQEERCFDTLNEAARVAVNKAVSIIRKEALKLEGYSAPIEGS